MYYGVAVRDTEKRERKERKRRKKGVKGGGGLKRGQEEKGKGGRSPSRPKG